MTKVWIIPADDRISRHRFAVCQAAQHLSLSPGTLALAHHENGQPVLLHAGAPAALQVSLSTSTSLAAIALSSAGPLGVDLQSILPPEDLDDLLIKNTLTSNESAALVASPSPNLFFTLLWTRKEAVLKAMGTGLFTDPHTLDLPPLQMDTAQQLSVPALDRAYLTTWQLSPTHCLSLCAHEPSTILCLPPPNVRK